MMGASLHHPPFVFGPVIAGLMLVGGLFLLVGLAKLLFFPFIFFVLPWIFFSKMGGCRTMTFSDGKAKNDQKAKRGDSPFYDDIEII
jgi:hypothetical protein